MPHKQLQAAAKTSAAANCNEYHATLPQGQPAQRLLAVSLPTPPADELMKLVERSRADVVCISATPPTATPPAAVLHARRLCKQLRGRFPTMRLVVGLWNAQFDLSKAIGRIGGGDKTQVVATLAQAVELVCPLREPTSAPLEVQTQPDGGSGLIAEARQ